MRLYDAGNPRVTPEVTRDVCLLARMMAANLYYSQIEDLMFEVIHISLFFLSFRLVHYSCTVLPISLLVSLAVYVALQ